MKYGRSTYIHTTKYVDFILYIKITFAECWHEFENLRINSKLDGDNENENLKKELW